MAKVNEEGMGAHSGLGQESIQSLKDVFHGEIILPGEKGFETARLVWNGMIDRQPAAIVRAADVQDVVAAVNFARAYHLRVAVRGGGHNVAGLAVADQALVIDLSRLKKVEVIPGLRIVRAGGGVTIGELDQATQFYGLAVPMGVVSETGIAGLTLGGGMGWLRNKYGLSCDNLTGAEVVTADGRIVYANQTQNPDLLWGLRGGGGNFGIVTEFEFQAHPVGPEVMFCFVFHDGERMRETLQFYRDFVAQAPDEVSTLAFAGMFPPGAESFPEALHGRRFMAIGGMYAGSPEDGRLALQPLRDFATPLFDLSDVMPYTQAQTMFDEDYPAHEMRYYWKSLNLIKLTDEALETFVEHARRQPSPYSTTDLWPVGGAVRRGGSADGAYFGRQAAFLMNPEANWIEPEDDAANLRWVREFVAAMQPYSDGSRYLNFAGFQEEGDQMMREAFGEHYQRLVSLKTRYDPDNFFRLNQNIPPSE
jgi:FAD/FMN-containing dehydrogenase